MKKISLALVMILVFFDGYIVYAESDYMPLENRSVARKNIMEWRYKIENGKLYKRLWNNSENRWETGWIVC